LCSILEPTTKERSDSDLIKRRPSLVPDDKSTSSASSNLPYPEKDQFPSIDLVNTSIVVTKEGNYELQRNSFFSSTQIELPPPDQQAPPTVKHIAKTETVNKQFLPKKQRNRTYDTYYTGIENTIVEKFNMSFNTRHYD